MVVPGLSGRLDVTVESLNEAGKRTRQYAYPLAVEASGRTSPYWNDQLAENDTVSISK